MWYQLACRVSWWNRRGKTPVFTDFSLKYQLRESRVPLEKINRVPGAQISKIPSPRGQWRWSWCRNLKLEPRTHVRVDLVKVVTVVMVLVPELENGASCWGARTHVRVDLVKVVTVVMILVPELENGTSGGGVRIHVSGENGDSDDGLCAVNWKRGLRLGCSQHVSDRSGEGGDSRDDLGAVTWKWSIRWKCSQHVSDRSGEGGDR